MGEPSTEGGDRQAAKRQAETVREARCDFAKAALEYADRGFCVHPCNGKRPMLEHWPTRASSDRETVEDFWARYPNANIGLVTGERSGVVVLDVDRDPERGIDGEQTLKALEQQYGPLPTTPQVRTGRGGRHLFFRHPGHPVKTCAGELGPGLDVRGDGGQAILPPSVHPNGTRYEWVEGLGLQDLEPAALPPAWISLLTNTAEPTVAAAPVEASVLGHLLRHLPQKGERNDTLTRIAGHLASRGLPLDAHEELLVLVNGGLEEPLPEREVRTSARSIHGAEQRKRAGREVVVNGRHLREIASDVRERLRQANDPAHGSPSLFVRDRNLIRVLSSQDERPYLEVIDEKVLRGLAERVCDFVQVTREGRRAPKFPPKDVIADVLALHDWPFPPLRGVTEVPVLRSDGSVLDGAGYDEKTRLLFYPASGLSIPALSPVPTTKESAKALALIEDVYADFPFRDQCSRANMYGLLLTPLLRPAFRGRVPLALMDSQQQGVGKGLAVRLPHLIATGREPPHCSLSRDDEELRKELTSQFDRGVSYILFDDISQRIDSACLAEAITAPTWMARRLGRTEMIEVEVEVTWVATGTNLELGGDMNRRAYPIRLDAPGGRPWLGREYRHPDLPAYVLEHRGELVWALLTLARAWWAAGQPKASTPVLGSFEGWCATVGGVLAHAGVEGFLGNLDEVYEEIDVEYREWSAFLSALAELNGPQSFTVAELHELICGPLAEQVPASLAFAKDRSTAVRRKIGYVLRDMRGRRHGPEGFRLERGQDDSHRKVARWSVRRDDNR